MDEVQVEINEASVTSEDLICNKMSNQEALYICTFCNTAFDKPELLGKHVETCLDLQTESESDTSENAKNLKELSKKSELFILKKERLDQNCDVLSAAIFESQIDREDFTTFENFLPPKESGIITKTEFTMSPILQLIPGRDISENFTQSDIVNTSSNPRGGQTNYLTHNKYLYLKENEIATLGLIQNDNLKCNATLKQKGEKPICTLCTKVFARNQTLKIHMESVHEGKKPFKCDTCGQKFAGKSSVKRHNEVVHEGKKCFQCSICKVQFSKKENLKKHLAAIHENNRPYLCNLCNSKFVANDVLQKHIKRVHEEKPFQCSACDLKVATKYQLNSHFSAIHEGKKPFKCSKCTFSFAYKDSFKKHIKNVHAGSLNM